MSLQHGGILRRITGHGALSSLFCGHHWTHWNLQSLEPREKSLGQSCRRRHGEIFRKGLGSTSHCHHLGRLQSHPTGPADALTNVKHDVKIEGDEEKALDEAEVVTPANVDVAPTDDQDDALMEEPQTLVTMRLPTHLVTQHSPQAKKILTQWRSRGERRLMLWEKFWTSQTR